MFFNNFIACENSSVGRASASQAEGREFETRFSLFSSLFKNQSLRLGFSNQSYLIFSFKLLFYFYVKMHDGLEF